MPYSFGTYQIRAFFQWPQSMLRSVPGQGKDEAPNMFATDPVMRLPQGIIPAERLRIPSTPLRFQSSGFSLVYNSSTDICTLSLRARVYCLRDLGADEVGCGILHSIPTGRLSVSEYLHSTHCIFCFCLQLSPVAAISDGMAIAAMRAVLMQTRQSKAMDCFSLARPL